ncbi:MAG: winged helix-turn-helix transcriptional regulator [Alphaproteobacteria bacterium]|nr:winged helix-turn-helix transcriptional regulator [Alphaproteobacteria bacterium]
MNSPDKKIVGAWTSLVKAQSTVRCEIDAALKKAGLPALEWYDVLWALERGEKDGVRPFQLQSQLLLPQYSVSRLLDRLIGAGLVECRNCEQDGRGQVAIITEAGIAMRARMWPVYGAAIQRALGDNITARQAQTLIDVLEKITAPARGTRAGR